MSEIPLLICMTPVRNEAWVLHEFLKATSIWADYIIIADQGSTDGSREIALSYPKVILIDNANQNFNEVERQKLLIDNAREIPGDKILFGLDSDEIFSANFMQTDDWQKIIHSKVGDVFFFKWAEICPNKTEYWDTEKSYPWVFHDDGVEPHGNYVKKIHSMRIPYPGLEKQIYYIKEFRVLHFAYLGSARVNAKRRFYKLVDWELNKLSPIKYSRSYAQTKADCKICKLPSNFLYNNEIHGFNTFDFVDVVAANQWYDDYVFNKIQNYDIKMLFKLDIWDSEFLKQYNIEDKRPVWIKLIHKYLSVTQNMSNKLLIRFIDAILIKFGF